MTSLFCNVSLAAMILVGVSWSMAGNRGERESTALPSPEIDGQMSLEKAVAQRRSVRGFTDTPPTIEQIGQLCWAGQGITDEDTGYRAAPSAGALYPIELYVVTGDGVHHYQPDGHTLERHLAGDVREDLEKASLGQDAITDAPTCIVVAAVVERTARKYGRRAERYCFMEAGHVAQNILLQATALGLAGVPIGAFDDDQAAAILKLPNRHRVLYVLPIGHPDS